jgi:phosphoribosylamine--glycine ligase
LDVLLVGGGGRENALGWRIARSPSLGRLWVTAANPFWPAKAAFRPAPTVEGIAALAGELRPDLVVVGPEAPLERGLADRLAEIDIPCFGPSKAAARLETSKSFAKEVLGQAGVPTPGALSVDRHDPVGWERAKERASAGRVVIKADGLAAGKGVAVCSSPRSALAALEDVTRFGPAATRVLLEDLIEGPEVSLFALCDGERAIPLPTAQDHKRLHDGDIGPNTGGMGAFAPSHRVDADQAAELVARIHQPILDLMAHRGTPFRGLLYAGLMMTAAGPQVLEFNARFGDPECQALMLLWEDDPLPWLHGAAVGRLPLGAPVFRSGSALCVVVGAPGYPDAPKSGISIPDGGDEPEVVVFAAGAERRPDGGLVTAGGRVLGITAWGEDLAQARERAYRVVERWRFPGALVRSDIGDVRAGR